MSRSNRFHLTPREDICQNFDGSVLDWLHVKHPVAEFFIEMASTFTLVLAMFGVWWIS